MRGVKFFGHDVKRLFLFFKFLFENDSRPLGKFLFVHDKLIEIDKGGNKEALHRIFFDPREHLRARECCLKDLGDGGCEGCLDCGLGLVAIDD